jgi:hypothetical protein
MLNRLTLFYLVHAVSSLVLKPVAIPMMEGGSLLAKSGEALVTLTTEPPFECYGGTLSAAGGTFQFCSRAARSILSFFS